MQSGLALHTDSIFQKISQLDCIKDYILVGGTALALHLHHRQSEDLDFMKWRTSKSEKMEIDWAKIEKELATIGTIEKCDIIDIDHVVFNVSNVKISFYASPKHSPVRCPIDFLNHLKVADVESIAAMKMEVMLRRNTFRDYYDIYAILKSGVSFQNAVNQALKYSEHKLSSKNLIAMLTNGNRFSAEQGFEKLQPKYQVSAQEIELFIKNVIKP